MGRGRSEPLARRGRAMRAPTGFIAMFHRTRRGGLYIRPWQYRFRWCLPGRIYNAPLHRGRWCSAPVGADALIRPSAVRPLARHGSMGTSTPTCCSSQACIFSRLVVKYSKYVYSHRRTRPFATSVKTPFILPLPSTTPPTSSTSATPTAPWPPTPWRAISACVATT